MVARPNTTINESQADPIRELSNMAINRSAGQLAELTGRPVQLTTPRIQLLTLQEFEHFLSINLYHTSPCINQNFYGSFSGRSLLLYPKKNATQLLSLLLNEEKEVENLSTMEISALVEVGNILINSFMGFVCETLNLSVNFTVPQMHMLSHESARHILYSDHEDGTPPTPERTVALMLDNEMTVEGTQTTGHTVLFIDTQTALQLVERMEEIWQG
ncbi:MAG: chemotaxis protein CheY-P-specific phosphatase CheC [Planctomycetota bacterium]|jgi:chemotaxis protein CheY-P-specific phosphatase CheC